MVAAGVTPWGIYGADKADGISEHTGHPRFPLGGISVKMAVEHTLVSSLLKAKLAGTKRPGEKMMATKF